MTLTIYDNCDENRVPFKNIAIEEYLTRHVGEDEVTLYLWQNEKTVVIGRNQNAWRECNVEKLAADGGYLTRRLSGGGAVYHNTGNVNFTFCAPEALYDVDKQVSVIAAAARTFGISVEKTGRNDIMADGKKFSGNAFWKSGGKCYHHGTILIAENMANMVKYLDTDGSKLRAKSVPSVPARVVNLADLNPAVTPESFRRAMVKAFGDVYGGEPKILTDADLDWKEIGEREAFFASDEWRFGHQLAFTNQWEHHFPWGFLRIYVTVDDGKVTEATIDSDGLASNLLAEIPGALKGVPYRTADMAERILSIPADGKEEQGMLEDIVKAMKN